MCRTSRLLLHQSRIIPKVTAFKELSGEERIILNEVRETGVLQLLEVVNVQRSTGGKTKDLILTTSSRCVPSYSFPPRFLMISFRHLPFRNAQRKLKDRYKSTNARAGMFTQDDLSTNTHCHFDRTTTREGRRYGSFASALKT